MKKVPKETADEVIRLYLAGEYILDISKSCGIAGSCIYNILKEREVQKRGRMGREIYRPRTAPVHTNGTVPLREVQTKFWKDQFAESLGDPPIGRSELDIRRAKARLQLYRAFGLQLESV